MRRFRESPPLQALPPKLFICYSHEDRGFVERLVRDLATNRILIWWDHWMIQVGDSLLGKVQEGISTSSYLAVVLTPSSVSSAWVQEELSAGMIRQLEERRVFLLPILAQECEIPLFLREKKYADFRMSYQYGLAQLLARLKPLGTGTHSRGDEGPYHHDYAIEWGKLDRRHAFRLHVATHSEKLPYAVTCEIEVMSNPRYSQRLDDLQEAGFEYGPRAVLLLWALRLADQVDAAILIQGDAEAHDHLVSWDPDRDVGLDFDIRARRLGSDPGEDILYDWKSILHVAVGRHMEGIRAAHGPEELTGLDQWLDAHPMDRP